MLVDITYSSGITSKELKKKCNDFLGQILEDRITHRSNQGVMSMEVDINIDSKTVYAEVTCMTRSGVTTRTQYTCKLPQKGPLKREIVEGE